MFFPHPPYDSRFSRLFTTDINISNYQAIRYLPDFVLFARLYLMNSREILIRSVIFDVTLTILSKGLKGSQFQWISGK